MNHQDIAGLLIGQEFSRLTDAQLSDVQLHLASCEDCASDWDIHTRLIAQPVPRMPETLEARCRAAVAARTRVERGRRKSGRYILVGVAIVIAAAAALVALRMARSPDLPSLKPANPAIPKSLSKMLDSEPELPARSNMAVVASDGSEHNDAEQAREKLMVVVMPPVLDAMHPVVRDGTEKYHAALIEQLRAMPGVTLIESEESWDTAAEVPNFRITVESTDRTPEGSTSNSRNWRIGLKAAPWRQTDGLSSATFSSQLIGPCAPDISAEICSSAARANAARLARHSVDFLRLRIFPRDSAHTTNLKQQLGDPHRSFTVRKRALDLLLQKGRAYADLDPAAIDSIVNLFAIAPHSQARTELWRTLSGIGDPELVQPLFQVLDRENDARVRLEAMTTLVVSFGAESAARDRFQFLAAQDGQPIMRQLARRALFGEGGWRRYVVETLNDARATDLERSKPLVHMIRITPATDMAAFLDNGEILAQLERVLPGTWNRPAQEQVASLQDWFASRPERTRLPGMLGAVKHVIALNILLEALRGNPDKSVKKAVIEVLGKRHLADERAYRELKKIAAADLDLTIREAADRVLKPGIQAGQGVK